MVERNENRYQLEQNNKIYILTTVLVDDKLKLVCEISSSVYEGIFGLMELTNLSKYFKPTYTIEQIQMYLNGIIEKQRVGITQNGAALSVILYLINNDQICIPLIKKSDPHGFDFDNYKYQQSTTTTTTQYMQSPSTNNITNNISSYYTKSNIPIQYMYDTNSNINQHQQYITTNTNQNNWYINPTTGQNIDISAAIPVQTGGTSGIPMQKKSSGAIKIQNSKQNIMNINNINNINQYPITDTSQNNYTNYQFGDNKIGKIEENTNIIKAEQQKMKDDMKRLRSEAEKLKEQNEVYKTDHNSLTQENATLKETNDYYKNQLTEYEQKFKEIQSKNEELLKINKDLEDEKAALQEENNSLKNQITLLNKDVDASDNQNNEIRKMYEELEKEDLYYKNQYEELNKENELLRGQVDELSDNFTLINNELEKIKNENNIFKTNLEEQQKNNLNDEEINRLIEENNLYKRKLEENDLLKKQIEDLQYQIQQMEQMGPMGQNEQERQDQDQDQDNQPEEETEEKEVKGDIIHDLKELEMLTKKINKDNNKKMIINLLYNASVDGDKASVFHEKCDEAQNTIVLVETKNGKRFGGFTTCSWSGNCVDKTDPQAFIFSFDKMKTYDNIPGDEAIGCYPKFGPIFLGCQIKIFDNAFTKGGTTFEKELNFNTEEDYELTGGDRIFGVKDIEVYEVVIE